MQSSISLVFSRKVLCLLPTLFCLLNIFRQSDQIGSLFFFQFDLFFFQFDSFCLQLGLFCLQLKLFCLHIDWFCLQFDYSCFQLAFLASILKKSLVTLFSSSCRLRRIRNWFLFMDEMPQKQSLQLMSFRHKRQLTTSFYRHFAIKW